MNDSDQEFNLDDLDPNYGKNENTQVKETYDDDAFIERCKECNRKMRMTSNYDYVTSIWKTTINPVFDIDKCNNKYHDHDVNELLCKTCCSKKDYVDHEECYQKISSLNDQVNKCNRAGNCNSCNVPFSLIHYEYGTCHTCYKKHCSLGFYDTGRMYQYVFNEWNNYEQYLVCKSCYDDKKTAEMNIRKPKWVLDDVVITCQHAKCTKNFGYIFGKSLKHHCRGCGKIMCTEHCSQYAFMPYNNELSRCCPDCFYKLNIKYEGEYKDLYKDHEKKYKKN